MKGITVIEVAIALAIVGIIAAVAFGSASSSGRVTFGPNGLVETRCIDGLKYVVGEGGQARQVISTDGTGVKCHE